jgi:hypothetical protein
LDRGLRRVDLWAAGQWLTRDDNMAYVKAFRLSVQRTAAWLRSGQGSPVPFDGLSPEAAHRRLMLDGEGEETDEDGELCGRFRALDWGPTTDNLIVNLFRDGEHLAFTLHFWREEHLLRHPEHVGVVFVVELTVAEFVGVLEDLVAALGDGPNPDSPVSG